MSQPNDAQIIESDIDINTEAISLFNHTNLTKSPFSPFCSRIHRHS